MHYVAIKEHYILRAIGDVKEAISKEEPPSHSAGTPLTIY
jgi:hypothetical protein